MKRTVYLLASITAFATFAVMAEEPAPLVEKTDRGRWTFSAGPAWRSRVKMQTRSSLITSAQSVPQSGTSKSVDVNDYKTWTGVKLVDDPLAGVSGSGVPSGAKIYGIDDTYTVVSGQAGSDYRVHETHEERPIGLNLQGCYDFYQGDNWSLGLNARFAGYWNLRSSSHGYYNAGGYLIQTYTDHYIFPSESPDAPFELSAYNEIEETGTTLDSSVGDVQAARRITTRLRSDFYQFGLGPKVTWTPFAESDNWNWLDVYGGVEALLNFAHTQLQTYKSSDSQVDCLFGLGANVGLVGNITDYCGIYGQVGYEWIDDSDLSTGAFHSNVDYSSLVISAGVIFRF